MCTNNCNSTLVEKFAIAIAPSIIGMLCDHIEEFDGSERDAVLQEFVRDVWRISQELVAGAPNAS